MADRLQLRIVTPTRSLVDEPVREVTAPGTAGEFGVLPNHIAFLSTLEIGTLRFAGERGPRVVAIRGGFAEVKDNVVTVLADDARLPEEVDRAAAQQALQEAMARVAALSPLDPAFAGADEERRWAQALLEVSRQ